ncbi:MAG: hypothetical protein ACTSUO_08575 [Candidatus Thorarchaeota archaeon]
MKIQVDKEGADIIKQLCDIALRQSGLQSLNGVLSVLSSMKVDPNLETSSVKRDKKEN